MTFTEEELEVLLNLLRRKGFEKSAKIMEDMYGDGETGT